MEAKEDSVKNVPDAMESDSVKTNNLDMKLVPTENISIVEPEIIPITGEGIQAIPIEVPEGAIGMVKEVQVYPGETLDDYVRVYSVTKEEILRANPQIQNEQLEEGFTIRIPISE